jgi:hypothetical protein
VEGWDSVVVGGVMNVVGIVVVACMVWLGGCGSGGGMVGGCIWVGGWFGCGDVV